MKNQIGRLNPMWAAALPLIALTALLAGPPERRLFSILVSAPVFALLQWLLPEARFRTGHYFSPINVALMLLLSKLVVVPVLLITVGSENTILAIPASISSMEGALLIDTVAYVAFCLGLQLTPQRLLAGRFSLLPALARVPHWGFVPLFAGLGLLGFFLIFRTVDRLLQYYVDPSSILPGFADSTWAEFFGTILRPFLAFALATWWTRVADQSRESGKAWPPVLAGLVAAVGITIANLTFGFNRAAFVFPILSLVAVYSARIRRISPAFTVGVLACVVPLLMAIGSFRSDSEFAAVAPSYTPDRTPWLTEFSESIQVYSGGPQLTGVFYDSVDWGRRLYGGVTLLSSILTPIPILGKGFRETGGPVVYNQALYGVSTIADQIIPFDAELFANFHIPGVLVGFFGFGVALAKAELWFDSVGSTFGAFVIQYISVWGAMLSTWSLSVFVQILFYFLGPVYLYLALLQVRAWLRTTSGRGPCFHTGEIAR